LVASVPLERKKRVSGGNKVERKTAGSLTPAPSLLGIAFCDIKILVLIEAVAKRENGFLKISNIRSF